MIHEFRSGARLRILLQPILYLLDLMLKRSNPTPQSLVGVTHIGTQANDSGVDLGEPKRSKCESHPIMQSNTARKGRPAHLSGGLQDVLREFEIADNATHADPSEECPQPINKTGSSFDDNRGSRGRRRGGDRHRSDGAWSS